MANTSTLQICTQGIRGGCTSRPKEIGLCEVYLGGEGFVTFDAFKGTGTDYQRREETQIRIVSNENKEVFKGTLDQLTKKLIK